ncbi:phage minor capsid protein [Enterococcus mundtii]|uniref:phage minor capsid protein n=1 Tax=Enterococcus mundtii TaxID=53346 RepID=UPI00336A2A78
MAITPKQLEIEAAYIQDAYMALEDELMRMLVRHLNLPTRTPLSEDNAFRWKIEKMQQLNMLNQKTIEQLVNKTSQYSYEQMRKIIVDMGHEVVSDADKQFSSQTGNPPPPRTNIDDIMQSYFRQQWLDFDNHVNQSLITTNYPNNPLAQMYQKVLNDATARLIAGMTPPQQALRDAIYAMVEKGVMTSFTDKAGRQWSLERYVRTVLKTTTHRTFQDLRLKRGLENGIVTAVMSSHAAARPTCAHIQGGWVLLIRTEDAPEELRHIQSIYDYGYGEPGGTQGINCGHILYSRIYDPGIELNVKQYDPEEAMENAETVAKQRRMEVAIRRAKRQLNAATELKNEGDVQHFKQLIRRRQAALRQLINDHSALLHRDYSREQVYS